MIGEDWIGRAWRAEDRLTDRLIAGHRVTFGAILADMPVPPGLHWALAPDILPAGKLGRDGHPKTGLVMPDLGLPRRMWAGGEIRFIAPFAPGDTVIRDSRVENIEEKGGRSGHLGFVRVRHVLSVNDETRLTERQDIVYREDPKVPVPAPEPAEDWPGAEARRATPDPVMLFRYSALTFNGHRIHYDRPYATSTEGYDGLVVHGPMQALWMMNLATAIVGGLPSVFRYRGLSPLIAGEPVLVEGRQDGDGLALRVRRGNGVVTMQAASSR